MWRPRRKLIGAAGLSLIAVVVGVAALWPRLPPHDIEGPARADGSGPLVLTVTDLQLGRAVGPDKRVTDPAEVFAAADTVYASVVTEGHAEHVRLTARWRQGDQVAAEVSQSIAPAGIAVSEFNAWRPRGWPAGDYEVQILVNDVPAAARRFAVR